MSNAMNSRHYKGFLSKNKARTDHLPRNLVLSATEDSTEESEFLVTRIMYLFNDFLEAAVESIMFCLLYEARNLFALSNAKIEQLCYEIRQNGKSNRECGKVLKDCLEIHDNVCNICVNVNKVFDIYLLFKFLTGFFGLVYSTMYLVEYNEHEFHANLDLESIVWVVLGVCEIIYLIVICEMTLYEARKLNTILIQVDYNFSEVRAQVLMITI
ncbi:hypothetical protein CBL_02501 [Carabus blaptoides fortunei]